MTFKSGDWYIYCDICGRRTLASKSTRLSQYTGAGGLLVCNHDVDKIDYSLVPFKPRREQNVADVRVNHTDTTNGSPLVDLESMTYQWYLASSQDGAIIVSSQDDAWIISSEPV